MFFLCLNGGKIYPKQIPLDVQFPGFRIAQLRDAVIFMERGHGGIYGGEGYRHGAKSIHQFFRSLDEPVEEGDAVHDRFFVGEGGHKGIPAILQGV